MNLHVCAFFAIAVKTLGKTSEKLAVGVKVYSGMSGTSKLAIYAPMIMALCVMFLMCAAVLRIRIRIRIHRIHMFLGLQDPDPDPSIIMQK